jgi:HK97 gp10 family phage protein
MELKTEVHGAEEINRALGQLPERLQRLAVGRALNAGADIVIAEAKARAPLGVYDASDPMTAQRARFGPLKSSIRRGRVRGRDAATVAVGIGRAFWGLFQEFGTVRMAARPWFRPAWEASKLQAFEAIRRSLVESLPRLIDRATLTRLAQRLRQ